MDPNKDSFILIFSAGWFQSLYICIIKSNQPLFMIFFFLAKWKENYYLFPNENPAHWLNLYHRWPVVFNINVPNIYIIVILHNRKCICKRIHYSLIASLVIKHFYANISSLRSEIVHGIFVIGCISVWILEIISLYLVAEQNSLLNQASICFLKLKTLLKSIAWYTRYIICI